MKKLCSLLLTISILSAFCVNVNAEILSLSFDKSVFGVTAASVASGKSEVIWAEVDSDGVGVMNVIEDDFVSIRVNSSNMTYNSGAVSVDFMETDTQMESVELGIQKPNMVGLVKFHNSDMKIYVYENDEGKAVMKEIGTFSVGEWYSVSVVIDNETGEYEVHIREKKTGRYISGSGSTDLANLPVTTIYLNYGRSGARPRATNTKLYFDNLEYGYTDSFSAIKTTPSNKNENVSVVENFSIEFSGRIKSVEGINVTLNGETLNDIKQTENNKLLIFHDPLVQNTKYTLKCSNVSDIFGNISNDIEVTFKTSEFPYFLGTPVIVYENGKVYADIECDSYDGEERNLELVLAVYDNVSKKIIGCEMSEYLYGDKNNQRPEIYVYSDDFYAKAFVLSGLSAEKTEKLADTVIYGNEKQVEGEKSETLKFTQDMNSGIVTVADRLDKEALIWVKNDRGELVYINDVKENNGFFAHEFDILYGESGEYDFYISYLDGNNTVCINNAFYYLSQSDITTLLEKFNEINSDLDYLINNNYRSLGINIDYYLKLTDEQREKVSKKIKDGIPYASMNEVRKDLNKIIITYYISNDATSQEVKGIISDNKDDFKVAVDYDLYEKMPDSVKENIYRRIIGKEYEEFEDVLKAFEEYVILTEIENSVLNNDVFNLLDNYSGYLGIDFGHGKNLSAVYNATGKMCGKYYNTKEELAQDFEILVENAQAEMQNNDMQINSGANSDKISENFNTILPEIFNGSKQSTEMSFTDIESVPWAAEAISALYEKGIINGRSDTLFAPNNNIKRCEFVKMVAETFLEDAEIGEISFLDIPEEAWYKEAVQKAYAAGVINGNGNNMFNPYDNITREDLVVILYRVLDYRGRKLNKLKDIYFADDNEISDYAKQSVCAFASYEVITGVDGRKFAPQNSATRAQAAKIIYCIMKKGLMV